MELIQYGVDYFVSGLVRWNFSVWGRLVCLRVGYYFVGW